MTAVARGGWRRAARALAASARDQRFERASPIPFLPSELENVLGRDEVVLPPASLARPGNQSMTGLLHLVSLGKALDATNVFEIGTYNGLTALTLAMNLPSAVIHTLDLPTDATPALPLFWQDHSNRIRFERLVYEGTPYEERVVAHRGDSAVFDFSQFDASAELVYIDGAHSYEYVSNDSAAAFRMLADIGAIVSDDYWRQVPNVARFLHAHPRPGMYRLGSSRLVVWFTQAALQRLRWPDHMTSSIDDERHSE